MKVYDYLCPDCGCREERFVRAEEMDEQFCTVPEPHCLAATPMVRLPPPTKTTFRFCDKRP